MKEVRVSINGSNARVRRCVKMMWRAKNSAHATVTISPQPHDKCGGPSMKPAPTVAINTPQYKARRGAWSLIHKVSTAVITT